MQDSIQLPDSSIDSPSKQYQNYDQVINFCVSPNESLKKPMLINNGSESSLAYSNSTKVFGLGTERSPLNIPNFESSKKKDSQYNREIAKYLSNQYPVQLDFDGSQKLKAYFDKQKNTVNTVHTVNSINQAQSHKNQQDQTDANDRRKTVNRMDPTFISLSRQKKQLEYALQLQVISSQELRTKVQILTELLQQNIKNSDFSSFLKLKNSSSNHKNIDIFIQMKKNHRKLKQKQLLVEQQNIEIIKLKQQLKNTKNNNNKKAQRAINSPQSESVTFNKQNYDSNRGDLSIYKKLEQLEEEKQSLFIYVEDLKKEYNQMQEVNSKLREEIMRYQDKQAMFVDMERPKLCKEINQKSVMIRELAEEVQKLKMEINLLEFAKQSNYGMSPEREIIQERQRSAEKSVKFGKQIGINTNIVQKQSRSMSVQAGSCEQLDMLRAQLDLLKSQRDHYLTKYKGMLSEIGNIHKLKVQLNCLKAQKALSYA